MRFENKSSYYKIGVNNSNKNQWKSATISLALWKYGNLQRDFLCNHHCNYPELLNLSVMQSKSE